MPRTKKPSKEAVPSVKAEFASADLGDARRNKRLQRIADAFSAAPDRSLPEIARDGAELEAIYRFAENDAFGFHEIVAPHFRATAQRVADSAPKSVLVVHDISECAYTLDEDLRDGFARLSDYRQGFRLQVSLALSGDGSKRPLGLLAADAWSDEVSGRSEVARWAQFVSNSRGPAPEGKRLIHVADREAGAYALFHEIGSSGDGFVVRLSKERVVELEEDPGVRVGISETAQRMESVYEAPIALSRRKPSFYRSKGPNRARNVRMAQLSFAAATVRLKKSTAPHQSPFLPKSLVVNLVCVTEINPPKKEEPVEWLLATTEPIGTREEIQAIVDIYRARWTVEEFFKALKTGCALEKRQLESFDALLKVLAISLVVAWRSLLLRHECRREPDAVVSDALTRTQIDVLRATGRVPLSNKPTNQEALFAVAALGGFIKNNKRPGWRVLARGMERLLEREIGWVQGLQRCDR